MTATDIPDLADVLAARDRIAPYLRPTPLYRYPALDTLTGARLRVKHENHLPVGAFKVRGGVNLIAQLSAAERSAASSRPRPATTASRSRTRPTCSACAPPSSCPRTPTPSRSSRCARSARRSSSTAATSTMRASNARSRPRTHGYRYIHSGNEPDLIAGVGTYALEILAERPMPRSSSCRSAAAAARPARASSPRQSGRRSRSSACSPRPRRPRTGPGEPGRWSRTARARSPRAWPPGPRSSCRSRSCGELLDDFVLVSDADLAQATRIMIEKTRNLVEPAGAAALAAVLADPARFAGRNVTIVCSGGNISPAQLAALLSPDQASPDQASPDQRRQ